MNRIADYKHRRNARRKYATRSEIDKAIREFQKKGGKITRLKSQDGNSTDSVLKKANNNTADTYLMEQNLGINSNQDNLGFRLIEFP